MPEALFAEYLRCFNANDWEGMRRLYTDDFTVVDHRRPALWEIDGPDDMVRQMAATVEEGFATGARIEVVALDRDAAAIRQTVWGGEGEAGWEVVLGQVIGYRGWRAASLDMFDPDDETAMLARLAELAPAVTVAPGVDPAHPMVDLWRRQSDAANRRDWDAIRALCAPGYRGIDRRALAWEELAGPDGMVMLLRSSAGATDSRMTGEIVAVADGLSFRLQFFAGHARDGSPGPRRYRDDGYRRGRHSSSRRGRPSELSAPVLDQPLEHLFGQPGPLDHVDEAAVRPARQLGVEPRLVRSPIPLTRRTPLHAPAGGHLGRPALAGRRRRDDAGRRLDRPRPGRDPHLFRQRLARPADPLGRRLVGRGVDVDRQDRHAVALRVVDHEPRPGRSPSAGRRQARP